MRLNKEKSREEGIELGEKRKAQETAQKMLGKVYTLDSTIESTGLTEEEIPSLLPD